MLLIYQNTDAWQALSEADRQTVMDDATALFEELTASGEAVGGDPLAAPSATKTVKVRDGVPAVTDGPFIESKEQFVGYLTVDVKSEERAIEIATRWPDARYWALEVRPILNIDG
jgi:hypothetical protein